MNMFSSIQPSFVFCYCLVCIVFAEKAEKCRFIFPASIATGQKASAVQTPEVD